MIAVSLKPQVRRPGSDHWDDISWEDAVNEIARWIKKTRDETFVEKDKDGYTVNRWRRSAGSAAALIPMS